MFFADLRYGFRQLRLNPGFTALAVVTLALGIGANTALFTVVRSVLLKPLPYRDPARLARVWMDNRRLQMHEDWASYLNYQDYKHLSTAFESMAAFTEPSLNLTSDGEPEKVRGAFAEAELFDVLGVRPSQGRLFTSDEENAGKANVVVIGWGLWQRRFGGADALGKQLDFDGRRFTVIGVMPQGFAFPIKQSEFWAPLVVSDQAKRRVGYWLQMVARMKPGVTPVQAQAEMDVLGARLEQQYPSENAGYGIFVNPLENHVAGNVKTPLLVLLGAVALVLLIACVNVAGLFLARAEARGREIVVRAALGASRTTLVRQLVMEAAALAAVAGAVGILASYAGVRALLWLAPADLPRLDEIGIDGLAVMFAVGVTTCTAILFGLWPAWRLSRVNLQDALREAGRGMAGSRAAARTRAALVVAQCALAILLLAGAGLLLRSLGALRGMDAGFRTSNVLTMRINASRTKYAQGPQLIQFYDQLLARVRALPGVKGAALTSDLFLSNTPNSGTFTLEDRPPFPPSEQIEATGDLVSPGFFETMQVRLVHGRFFDGSDKEGRPDDDRDQRDVCEQVLAEPEPGRQAPGLRPSGPEQSVDHDCRRVRRHAPPRTASRRAPGGVSIRRPVRRPQPAVARDQRPSTDRTRAVGARGGSSVGSVGADHRGQHRRGRNRRVARRPAIPGAAARAVLGPGGVAGGGRDLRTDGAGGGAPDCGDRVADGARREFQGRTRDGPSSGRAAGLRRRRGRHRRSSRRGPFAEQPVVWHQRRRSDQLRRRRTGDGAGGSDRVRPAGMASGSRRSDVGPSPGGIAADRSGNLVACPR